MRPCASLLAALAVLCGCGDDKVAGGSGTSTGNGLEAIVTDSSGTPAPGARLVARRADWSGADGGNSDSVEAFTDGSGVARFQVPPGEWLLDVTRGTVSRARRVRARAGGFQRIALVLARPASAQGVLPTKYHSLSEVRVCLLGTSRCAIAVEGKWRLDALPVHDARIAYLPESGVLPDTLDGIRLASGGISTVDSSHRQAWSEPFDQGYLDRASWTVRSGDGCPSMCRWGAEYLSVFQDDPAHVAVDDSGLLLRADRGSDGIWHSGSVTTEGVRSWRRGRFEFEAMLPTTRGVWPLVSLFPDDTTLGAWPASGSIDMVSLPGLTPDTARFFAHYTVGGIYTYTEGKAASRDTSWSRRFHRFACEWSDTAIRWSVDDTLVHRAPGGAPFDRPFHLQIDLHVGGAPYGAPDSTSVFPARMRVRNLRIVTPWN